jgi:hypothetical protein
MMDFTHTAVLLMGALTARRRLVPATVFCLLMGAPAAAQPNVLDLRVAEVTSSGDLIYQNFIYDRTFAAGRIMLEALYLRLPADDNNEVSIGAGYRVADRGGVQAYLLAHVAKATDAPYVQPALLVLDTSGRLTGSLFVQHYVPVDRKGIHQWLVDSAELQYTVGGPIALGVSAYLFRPEGGDWLTKVGPKLAVADKRGATELRIARVNTGGYAFQFRRLFVF